MTLDINKHSFDIDSLPESLKNKEVGLKTDPESVLRLYNSCALMLKTLNGYCDYEGVSLEGKYAEAYDTLYKGIVNLVDKLFWSCDQINDDDNDELFKALKYKG